MRNLTIRILLYTYFHLNTFIYCQLQISPEEEECPYLKAQNTLISILEDPTYNRFEQPGLPVDINITVGVRDVSDVNELRRYTSFLITMMQVCSQYTKIFLDESPSLHR